MTENKLNEFHYRIGYILGMLENDFKSKLKEYGHTDEVIKRLEGTLKEIHIATHKIENPPKKPGVCYLRSERDERWNIEQIPVENLVFSDGMPKEVTDKLKDLKKLHGEQPIDLEWGGVKY